MAAPLRHYHTLRPRFHPEGNAVAAFVGIAVRLHEVEGRVGDGYLPAGEVAYVGAFVDGAHHGAEGYEAAEYFRKLADDDKV